MVDMFLADWVKMGKHYRGIYIDVTCKFGSIGQCGFRGEAFSQNKPIKNRNLSWQPCFLLIEQNQNGPCIDVACQVV